MRVVRTNPSSMRLSWNEIRVRASTFASEWKDAHYEKGEAQTFYNEFFEIFGVTRRRVASFEEPVKKLDDRYGFIDLFWKGVLLVEQKSAGRDLTKAKKQAFEYFPGIKEADLPRFVLVSDFQTFELYDLDEDVEYHFPLSELAEHVEAFGFIIGVQRRTFKDQDPVNVQASELMGRLHDALEESGYIGHDLERLLVRLLFCLFADDTGIFEPRDIFMELLVERTREDGSDLGSWLSSLFEVLNTPVEDRQRTLDEDLARFPYVNGDLFEERLRIPAFDSGMRKILVEACEFSWDAISPAIFGSLFQSVMEPEERRAQGAHYTTEKNILKVIEPLFLDDLRIEFHRIKELKRGRAKALGDFQDKLGTLQFFDPACGCGNFLIIAYRELRELEMAILRELNPRGQRVIDVTRLSRLNVNQFYGMEIDEFPARIAEVALWMMDHIMNNRLSLEFGEVYARIPLTTSPHIHAVDALETSWEDLLSPTECSYIFGNPPFGGFHYRDTHRQEQMTRISSESGAGGRIDYVAAWFLKAGKYLQKSKAHVAFVATNSITQGEQVAQIWPSLFSRYKLEIEFAHRTFAWGSDARGRAHVHVVIIGLSRNDQETSSKRLFTYETYDSEPTESIHRSLSPYLFDASALNNRHLVVARTRTPLNGLPPICVGSKPVDGGIYILNDDERDKFIKEEPNSTSIVRPFIGGREHLHGSRRWIIYPEGTTPQDLRRMPAVMKRISDVREYRQNATGKLTRSLANTPTQYHVTVVPTAPFLALPEVSSERREYLPIGWLEPPAIPSNKLLIVPDATLDIFALLISRMHMSWLKNIGGRLESRYQYSGGIVYNTFPMPVISETAKQRLSALAQSVLDTRSHHSETNLADLYDPNSMPSDLRRAHQTLDTAVDRLYRRAQFTSDRERVEHLFGLYEKLVAPLTARSKTRLSRRRAR